MQASPCLGEDKKKSALASTLKKLGPRWFVVREAKESKLALLTRDGG
jgi:hypothetical protein